MRRSWAPMLVPGLIGHKSLFKDFPCVRKCSKGPGSRPTPQPILTLSARSDKGCNKERGQWLPCPKGCCCKSSICHVANARRAGSPFVPCFVLCALQLLALQSKAYDVKPLNGSKSGRQAGRFSLYPLSASANSRISCASCCTRCISASQANMKRAPPPMNV